MSAQPSDITDLLQAWSGGDRSSIDDLIPLIYDELREMASRYLGRERSDHTLQPTALVHEAYFRLIDQREVRWNDRAHFFAIAAQIMRRILVDHARSHRYAKRGGAATKISLNQVSDLSGDSPAPDLVALDDALRSLSRLDPDKASIVELRFFGGLSLEETAEVIGSSRATVVRQWRIAKAWLYRELKAQGKT